MDNIYNANIYYATHGVEFVTDTRDYTDIPPENIKLQETKTAIVFGVTGQDGSYLSEILLDKDYVVVGVKRRSSVDTTKRIKHIDNEKFIIVEGDVTDSESVNGIIKEYCPTHIFNLAAQSHVGTSFKQPLATWDSTATGVLNILNAIKNINPKIKFYQASTSEMFGKNYSEKDVVKTFIEQSNHGIDIQENRIVTEKFQDEHTPLAPQSPYAVAKVAAHNLVSLYRDAYGIFACSGILFNHESPRRGENFVTRKITKYVAKVLSWMRDKNPPGTHALMSTMSLLNKIDEDVEDCIKDIGYLELGNLDASRDWGHARDYCKGMVAMLEQDSPDDYVLATGETRTVREFLVSAFSRKGFHYEDFVRINPEFYRPAEVEFLKGDATKASIELGWSPETSFDKLVEEMVNSDFKEAESGKIRLWDDYNCHDDGVRIEIDWNPDLKVDNGKT